MKYVWVIKPIELFNTKGTTWLCVTNCKKLRFSEKLFANKNAYAQRKKTDHFVGLVLKTGKNLSIIEYFKLVYKLKEKAAKGILKGKKYSEFE